MSTTRAPFLWTPRQPIAADVASLFLKPPKREEGQNRWFLFRTVVNLAQAPASAPVDVTVDGRYILYVNGVQVGRGPVRCSPLAQRYDSYDLGPYLHPGSNAVAVLVHTYGADTAFYETVKGLWAPAFGDGGLWMEGPVVSTRNLWRCLESDAWDRTTPRANDALGFIEALDARRLPPDWTSPDFDDSDWDEARPLVVPGQGPESFFGGMSVAPFPILTPRGMPPLREDFVRAQTVRWTKTQLSTPQLPIHRRLYEEALKPAHAAVAAKAMALIDSQPLHVKTEPGEDLAFCLDFGRILSGYPAFEIEAKGGETIEIACSERLPGEWEGSPDPDARIVRMPLLGKDAHLCRYTARPGVQAFQRFEWCAVRYMHVVVRDAPQGLVIHRLGAVQTHYPVAEEGRFACSDPLLTKLWALGAYTLKQCMQDGWIDCPSREQRQWLGDVTVEHLAAWAAFGASAAPLTAKYLVQVAESQRPDGLTQMYAPGDHGEHRHFIPDWTLQWILCAADYWSLTSDLETIEAIWPSVQKALQWFDRIAGPHGLIVDLPYWHFMDWAGLGRAGQALALNAQWAGACQSAAHLAQAVGHVRAAGVYRAKADAITQRLNRDHWDDRRGVWVDAVSPGDGEKALRVSQHGFAALSLWGDPPVDRLARAAAFVLDPNRETMTPAPPVAAGTPLDEENGVVMANTFYGHFVGEALARQGRCAEALAHIRRRFGPMVEAGATTLWESMTPTASLCHGFSASPTYFMSRHILGVAPAAPGFAQTTIAPDLADLDWAEGVVAAGPRRLQVRLDRTANGFSAVIEGADESVDLAAAKGWRLTARRRDGDRLEGEFAKASGPAEAVL